MENDFYPTKYDSNSCNQQTVHNELQFVVGYVNNPVFTAPDFLADQACSIWDGIVNWKSCTLCESQFPMFALAHWVMSLCFACLSHRCFLFMVPTNRIIAIYGWHSINHMCRYVLYAWLSLAHFCHACEWKDYQLSQRWTGHGALIFTQPKTSGLLYVGTLQESCVIYRAGDLGCHLTMSARYNTCHMCVIRDIGVSARLRRIIECSAGHMWDTGDIGMSLNIPYASCKELHNGW
jgi:hypothetical protein